MSITPNRRRFLGTAAAAAMAYPLGNSLAWAADDKLADLRKHADPLALAQHVNLPDSENAYGLLLAAAKPLADVPVCELEIEQYFRTDDPDASRDAPMAQWLDKHEQTFVQVVAAVKLGKLEFPNTPWNESGFENLSCWRRLSEYLRLHAQRLAGQGKLTAAIDASQTAWHAFRLLAAGGGVKVDFVVASGCEMFCWKSMRALAQLPNFDAEATRRLLVVLPAERDIYGAVRRALQAEFTYFLLPQLAETVGCNVDQTVRNLIDWKEVPNVRAFMTRKEHEARCAKLVQLFAGHKQPYDAADTVKLASKKCVAEIRDLDIPWQQSKQPVDSLWAKELAVWPAELSLDVMGADGEADKVTASQLAAARRQLSKVKNPIGKKWLLTVFEDPPAMHRLALGRQAQYQGTRVFLATCAFQKTHDQLPQQLEQLVGEKILDVLPLDPFSGKSFQYSREQKALWSIGWDGHVRPGKSPDEITGDDESHLWTFNVAK